MAPTFSSGRSAAGTPSGPFGRTTSGGASPSRGLSPAPRGLSPARSPSRGVSPVRPMDASHSRLPSAQLRPAAYASGGPGKPGSGRVTSPSESMIPFSRTAAVIGKKQMSMALKHAHADRDTFRQKRQARTVAEHRLRHLSTDDASPTINSSRRNQWAPTDEQAKQAFREALRCGKVRPRTLKLMFVGQARAGKTSTLKALTGRGFNPSEPSTHGLATVLPLVETESSEDALAGETFGVRSSFVSRWQVINRPEHEVHAEELHKGCAQYITHHIAARLQGEGGLNSREISMTSDEGRGESDVDPALSSLMVKMPVDLLTRVMQGDMPDANEDEPVILKTWDFGGQHEYYVMHHLFITNRGVYIVVTRLDSWLRGDERDAEEPSLGQDYEPPLEALTFWLSSIHVHAPDALVVIVGTHSDRIPAALQREVENRVEAEILWLLEQVPGVERQVVVNEDQGLCFFPISNAAGAGDPALRNLRECIDQAVNMVRMGPSKAWAAAPTLRLVQTVRTIPKAMPDEMNTCGRITVHPAGNFVLVSNRGHDSMAVFKVHHNDMEVPGMLTLANAHHSGGATPRHFAFDESGQWLIAANQDSDHVAIFSFNLATGNLVWTRNRYYVPSPNFVCSVRPHRANKRLPTSRMPGSFPQNRSPLAKL